MATKTLTDMQARIAAAEAAELESANEVITADPDLDSISQEYRLAETGLVDRAHTMDQSDLAMPRILIAQSSSKVVQTDALRKGQWYMHPDVVGLGDKIDVVFLNMFKSRAYFEMGQGLLCRSYDLIQGVGTPGIKCDECALAKWPPKEEGGGRPKCALIYNYTTMVVGSSDTDETDGLMGVLSLSGTSAATARLINTLKSTRNGTNGPWYPFRFQLGLRQTENKRGTYYVATAKFVGRNDEDVMAQAMAMAEALDPLAEQRSVEMGED